MSDAYDFDEQLEFGTDWEAYAKDRLRELFSAVSVSNIDYDDSPDLQRAGVDILFQKDTTSIDVKTQRHDYIDTGNLPIEVLSVVEDVVPGWFHDAESDLVVWVYPNKAKTNLHKTGYLMPLTEGIREWFDETADEYRYVTTKTTGRYGTYNTGCRLVPVEDFPPEYLVEFDPRIPTDRETPQSDIRRWAGETHE